MTGPEPIPPNTTEAPPNSYHLVLPPGWAQIPLRYGTDNAVRRIVDHTFENLPRDEVFSYRRDLEATLGRRVREAQNADGLDLYLPVELMHGISVPASILISETRIPGDNGPDPHEVALFLASSGDDLETVDLDGVPSVRTERTAPADAGREVEFPSRQVNYQVPVPQAPGRWLTIAFSTVGSEDADGDLSLLLVDLFDAVMTTFRWSTR
ncbi:MULTISPECIES: hypothetical protein [unclassified Streptomyces]|uniref:hypothetical protein n=1 Tax=unclassified Streptomyces TaxID=2593676 RepID=UPI002DD8FCE8|nr:hypothetical protein [Streptomyces sp. NBC_01766]WSC20613.1 hypothetical protein OIE60_13445 [Streptomyces sp. NBC_01766]WSV54642.1 hypothetical protein OG282_13500 [Streptomyces sp. NBC_01014]